MPDADGYGPDPFTGPSGSSMDFNKAYTIGSGTLALGMGVYNTASSGSRSKKTREHEKEMADIAWQRQIEAWNMQNAYNTPEAQMARLKSAGLNPKLIYGNGTASSGNAEKIGTYNAPRQEYNALPLQFNQSADVISRYQDIQMKNAQIDLVRKQTELTEESSLLKEFEREFLGPLKGDLIQGQSIRYNEDFNQAALDKITAEIAQKYADIALKGETTEKTKYEKVFQDMYNKAIEKGINLKTDGMIQRIIYQLLEKNQDAALKLLQFMFK